MSTNFDANELRALFGALQDGTITAGEHARLEKILMENGEARQLWYLHSDIETGMADWAAMRQQAKEQKIVDFSGPPFPPSPWRWVGPLAAAALFLVGAILWMKSHTSLTVTQAESEASGVAVLARAVGVEWADGVERRSATVLERGRLQLQSGAALIEFYSGARLIVEGPADIDLLSAGEAFLRSGRINAHVPPPAIGFTVNTASLKVVDRGTDFGLRVEKDVAPEVHVFQGKVEIASAGAPLRLLQGGEAVRFEPGAAMAIPAIRAGFVTEEELIRRDTASSLQRFHRWREAARGLRVGDDTVVHFTFGEAGERGIRNQAPAPAADSDGSIVGSAWSEGRWPGKGALQFRSEGDRVRFTVAQSMQAITLVAWLRVDALPHWQNVLLASESEQPGAIHWHVTQLGELRLEIARDLGHPSSDWEAVNSAPFVKPDRNGQWIMLATTFDGSTIRHYGNGQPIGQGASFTPPALHIGTAELANWRGTTKRNLFGAVDELAIAARALSAEEIYALYESGRP